ncbi:ABC transporter permease [Lentzea sp. NEAU-D7]|uniref:ABC transporter permease n=1 Tax=Lentzea sp. NEAU-D7 TaxID=2994667 RepID=UPI00224A8F17|nr:ABC transporter permease [Lentzea sp. NEAU-D7]MCX2954601.1 ABC transporter permease [Lentzea sp. NEAU-D7]
MRTVLITAVAGAGVAFLLGLLTFGVQATVHPHDVPLAVVAPPPMAERVARADSAEIDIRVVSADEARNLLRDKEVYGVLEIAPGQATIRLNPAVNPSGTQVAQQVLTGVAQGAGLPVEVEAVTPTAAERTAPLAASALLWVGGMIAGLLFVVLKGGRLRWLSAVTAAVLVTGSTAGLLAWWGVTFSAQALAFLLAVAVSFALLQAGLFKHLGVRAMGVLGVLYLMAPAVAGQVPELLNPVYRAVLWSWTPFRFSAEGLRSLMYGGSVGTEWWVFGGVALIGLVLLAVKKAGLAGEKAQADRADGIVDVGVHQADGLPGAERQHTA